MRQERGERSTLISSVQVLTIFNSFYTYQLCILQLWISISPNLAYFVNGKQHGFCLCTAALNKHLGQALVTSQKLPGTYSKLDALLQKRMKNSLLKWMREKKNISIVYLSNYLISNIWVNLVQAIVLW